jgi:hypothetical protein
LKKGEENDRKRAESFAMILGKFKEDNGKVYKLRPKTAHWGPLCHLLVEGRDGTLRSGLGSR